QHEHSAGTREFCELDREWIDRQRHEGGFHAGDQCGFTGRDGGLAEHLHVAWSDVEPGETERVDWDECGRNEHEEPSQDGAVSGDFVVAVPGAAIRKELAGGSRLFGEARKRVGGLSRSGDRAEVLRPLRMTTYF